MVARYSKAQETLTHAIVPLYLFPPANTWTPSLFAVLAEALVHLPDNFYACHCDDAVARRSDRLRCGVTPSVAVH